MRKLPTSTHFNNWKTVQKYDMGRPEIIRKAANIGDMNDINNLNHAGQSARYSSV